LVESTLILLVRWIAAKIKFRKHPLLYRICHRYWVLYGGKGKSGRLSCTHQFNLLVIGKRQKSIQNNASVMALTDYISGHAVL
jgi:hypothetical protein